jgi:hypothetical protein
MLLITGEQRNELLYAPTEKGATDSVLIVEVASNEWRLRRFDNLLSASFRDFLLISGRKGELTEKVWRSLSVR